MYLCENINISKMDIINRCHVDLFSNNFCIHKAIV